MSTLFRFYLAVLFGLVFSSVSIVFAYSNTDVNSRRGESASAISGWVISNVQYKFASDPAQISAVEFDLNSPAGEVRVKLSSKSPAYFTCVNTGHYHWHCQTSGVGVVSLDELRVIATSQ
jgi:hypothetical protein